MEKTDHGLDIFSKKEFSLEKKSLELI